MATGYIICVIAAMGLLIAYSAMVKTKEFWLMMLYVCVSVVNLGYFAAMIGTIIHSVRRKKIGNPKLAGFIAAIVCGNIVIWLFEKMVSWEYEFLSVTYIISELLLLLVYWMMQDYVLKRDIPTYTQAEKEDCCSFIWTRQRKPESLYCNPI